MTLLGSTITPNLPLLFAHLLLGLALGGVFFIGLWQTVRRLPSRMPVTLALSSIARVLLLGGVLFLVSREGAAPLLVTGAGIAIARFAVMRRLRRALP